MVNEWGIKTRVLFLTLVPTITISLLLSAYFTSTRIQDLEESLKDRGYAIALKLAPASEYGVFSANTKTLQQLAAEALSEPEVRLVSIFNKEGKLLAHAGHENKEDAVILSVKDQPNGVMMADTGSSLLFTVPITIRDVIIEDYAYADSPYDQPHQHDNVIGWISIELSRTTTTLRQYQVLFACGVIIFIGLAISGIFAYRMGRDVTRPILQMAYAVEKIKNGDYNTRVYTHARGELRHLEAGINTMGTALKAAHEEMQQSIEQATADLRQTLETIEIQNIELEMARKEAETASRVKSEFLANMSHEIRTPLNGVIGFINLLMKTKLNSRQTDYLSTIHKSATSLLSIINDILDFSKIEAGKLSLDQIPMDLPDCIEDALTLMAPSAHEKALELVPMIYTDVPEKIIGDHLRLKQIITNLVNNSIKFTHSGSVIVRVMLEKETHKHVVLCVSITDSGIGLSKEEQKSLFQAFKQADSTTTRKFGGTGLGLVISKRLVQQMGGEIGVESEEDKGSTFWFTFLADKAKEQTTILPRNDLKGHKVLIYEPHPTTRLSLNHLFSRWEMIVKDISSTENIDAILTDAKKKGAPFDFVIIGVNQPDASGHFIEELINLIKGKHNCPVGVLLNSTEQIIHDAIFDAGAALCQAKPIRRKRLYDAITEVLTHVPQDEDIPEDVQIKLPTLRIPNSDKLTVLTVDDYEANLKLVNALLEDVGINVFCATNGKDALQLVAQHSFDLILMDIQMPEMDGIEVTNRIRSSEPPGVHTPIIALTAHALLSEREELLCAGMDDYLTKPINEQELQRVIAKWTNKQTLININSAFEKAPTTHSTHKIVSNVPIDWKLSLKLAGFKPALAKEMLEGLIETLPKGQTNINKAFSMNNLTSMREHVHHLHGACCYAGVPHLKAAAANLETAITEKAHDKIQFMMVELNKEINKILAFIKNNKDILNTLSQELPSKHKPTKTEEIH